MEIITGYTGKAHIFSEQDRDVNIGIVGEGSYVLQTGMQLEAEVSSNNEIKIRDGVLMHQGCTASIKKNTYDSLTIINGSQGMKRIDLIVARYERNQDNRAESIGLKVIQGTPAESNPAVPSHITGDIQSGDAVADMPMYKIIIDGLNITEVQKVYSEAPNITELNRKLNKVYRTKPVSGVEVVRVGNTVTLNVNRVVGGVQGNFVYSGHFGTVPPGYRPATENSLLLVGDRIVGSTVVGKFYASIFPDGKIEWSSENSHSGPNSYVFYATYVTSDQLPVE